jgi:diketogulonate reductase-like aldo/keto reductase
MYGMGAAEEIAGEAIQGRRDEVFLVSKVLPANASRRGTVAACEATLGRLKTDRLDCYLVHWRGRHPLGETVAAFEALKQEGKILSWGVSNFDVDDLEDLSALGVAPVCNQVLYHLQQRAIEHAVIPWCEKNGVAVVAYSPFGQNHFPAPDSAEGQVLQGVADAHESTPRQVALAFLVQQGPVFAIPKAVRHQHLTENAGAGDLQLSAADVAAIDLAFPRGKRPRSLPMI